MRTFVFALLVSLLVWSVPTVVGADDPLPEQPRPDQFPGLAAFNPTEYQLLHSGGYSFFIEDRCGAPRLIAAIQEAVASFSRESGAVSSASPDFRIRILCGVEWTAAAGTTPNVVGCLCEGFPYNTNIVLNGSMEAWSFDISRLAVVLHELLHALLTWNEQYGIGLVCLAGWYDFMNCGPDSRHDFDYIERARLERTTIPSPVGGTLFGDAVVYGTSDRKAVRVAVFFETYAGYIYWSGTWLPPCAAGNYVCVASIPDPGVCQGVWLGAENALPISWGRNLQLAGWSSCS